METLKTLRIRGWAFARLLDHEEWNENIVRDCLEKDPMILEFVPKEFKSRDIVNKAVLMEAQALKFAGDVNLPQSTIDACIEADASLFRYVRYKNKTQKMCESVLNSHPDLIGFVPLKFFELIPLNMKKRITASFAEAITLFEKDFTTRDICDILEENPEVAELLCDIHEEYIGSLIIFDPQNIRFLSPPLLTEKVALTAVGINPWVLEFLPKETKTLRVVKKALDLCENIPQLVNHVVHEVKGPVNDNCPICLAKIEDGAVKTPCAHIFHRECIVEWFRWAQKCPYCNQEFVSISDDDDSLVDISSESDASEDDLEEISGLSDDDTAEHPIFDFMTGEASPTGWFVVRDEEGDFLVQDASWPPKTH